MSSNQSREQLPLVLVCSDIQEIAPYRWHAVPEPYLRAITQGANAAPIILPSLGKEISIESILSRIDGVMLTGARSNVNPTIYGKEADSKHGPFDPDRDETTMTLTNSAIAMGIPLLAICRGMQELNVALGGTLAGEIQEKDGRIDHRSPQSEDSDVKFQLAHPIVPIENGFLASILGSAPVEVNSLHRQSVDILSDKLNIEATAEDGTVEAVSVKDSCNFALGVQWHPEYWVSTDKPSRQIFEAFGKAMRDYQTSQ